MPEGTAIRYSAESTVSDPKICGIISNGYPHMSLSDLGLQSVDEAYYATKTAVWIYLLGNWTTSGLGVNPNLTGAEREAAQRVLQATKTIYQRGMYWTELVGPQLTATPDRSTAYAATINGEECYQQVFTIDSNTWALTPVQLSLDGGAPAGTKIMSMDNDEISQIILDTTRTAGAGYQAKVKVVYPKSAIEGETGTCQLRLSATVVEYKLFYASTLEADKYGNLQNYILDTDPNTPATATAISSYSSDPDIPDDEPDPEPEDSTLTIYKKEEGTADPLDGAVFQILNPDGSELGSLPTVDGKITVPITVFGNYTVTELSPPKYHLLPEIRTQNVTVTATSPGELTFWNAPYGSLRVHKVSNTGENLSGVTIQIKNLETGETQSGQTGPGGVIEFTELKPGGYEVREVAGITGWQLDGETVETVTVVAGECSEATFINKELPGLRIIKYDRSSDKRAVMPDVTFEIWRDGTSIGKFTTDQTGEIVLTNAQPGTYVVQEVDTGDAAHLLDTTPQQIELRAGDGIRELVFFNDLKPQINRIIKVDSSDLGKPIANAKFEIKAVNGSFGPVEMTTLEDGTISLDNLPVGAYVVTELSCPGYVIDDAQRIIELHANDKAQFVFTNSKLPSLHLMKVSSDGSPLAGVGFQLAKIEDGSRYLDRTTSSTGEILWEGLEPGVYSLKETFTVEDHILDLREYHVELFAGKVSEVVLENQKRPNLTVYKNDANSGAPIAETVFTVRAADGHSVDEIKTGANGRADLYNLLPGVYEISEKSVPDAYLLDAPGQLVTLYPNRDHTVYFENHKKPTLTVKKVSSVTGSPLEGAKFNVTYASNNTSTGEINDLGTFYTNADGEFSVTYLDGWYKVTELASVPGFSVNSQPQELYVSGGSNVVMTFENVPLSGITVYKYDSVTKEALSNCTFEVRYLTDTSGTGGTVIGIYRTGPNGSFTVTGLYEGTYIVEEVSSDDGHVIDTAPQTVYLSGKDQDVVQLYFGNTPKGSVLITKKDALSGAPLSNVEFFVTDSSGAVLGNANGKFYTDAAGSILIDNLEPGTTVVARESRAKSGYVLDDMPQSVKVKPGETVSLNFLDQPKGNLIVEKYDKISGERLSGAVFRITNANGELIADDEGLTSSNGLYTTNHEGQIVLSNVTPATLMVTEVTPPEGYRADQTPQTVVIDSGDTQTLRFYDDPLCSLTLFKRDAKTLRGLSGASFYVRYSDGRAIGANNGRYVTEADGTVTITGIKPDATVLVSEERAPSGYIKDDSVKSIVVKSGAANSLTFDNEPTTTLVIRKYVDGTNYEPLAHVGFKVVDGSGAGVGPDGGTYFTDNAGEIVLTGLEPGITVTAYEFKTVDGMLLDGTPQSIQIKGGEVQHLTFFDKKLGTLVVKKLSSADKKTPLEGVEFLLTYAGGGFVDNANGHLSSNGIYFTDSNGEIRISGIVGTIVCTEQKSIDGYSLGSDRKQVVTVRADETQTLYFYNDPWQVVVLQKYISSTTKPLAGVTFLLTDGSGAPIGGGNGEFVTDANGRITISAPVGTTIQAREVKTVPGYTLNPETQVITVKGGVSAQTVTVGAAASGSATVIGSGNGTGGNQMTFYDTALGKLELVKVDAADQTKRLANATFEIRRMDQGVVTTVTTGKDGRAVIELDAGSYYALEVKAPPSYWVDDTPVYFTISDGKTTTKTVTNKAVSGIEIHKTDSTTGEGIYEAKFLIYDANNKVVGELSTNDRGYARIEVEAGRYRLRELECEGYVVDTKLRDVTVKSGEVTLVEWENTPITGQIQVIKYAAEANSVTGQAAGTPLQGATFEIVNPRNNAVVAHITSDARGIAASGPLPLGRYLVREVSSPAYWQVSTETFDVTLEFAGQIVKLAAYDKPSQLGVVLTKTGIKEVLAGNRMAYTFTVANTSNVALDNFFWHDKLPYDVTNATAITTGTYSQRLTYRILYKTNMNGYRVLASNLLSTNNYAFQLSGLPLMAGEVVTDIYYEFGKVPAGFQSVAKPTLTVSVSPTAVNGYQVINRADAGGQYGGTWETANASWITIVRNLTPVKKVPLPKTGY